jgi:uncharacterized membrane protein
MSRFKQLGLWVMALFYLVAGLNHFRDPGFYLQMMPPYIPWHRAAIVLSGVAEIALGIGLVIPRWSRWAAWGVIALLIAVFPANIYMWTAHIPINGREVPPLFHAIRLPAQALLILWAYAYTRPRADTTAARV